MELHRAVKNSPPQLLVFDLDGTLVSGTDDLAPEVLDVLRAISVKGVPIAVATGRPWFGAKHIVSQLPTSGVSMFSGGSHFVNTTNSMDVEILAIEKPVLMGVLSELRKNNFYYEVYDRNVYVTEVESPFAAIHASYLKQEPRLVADVSEFVSREQIIKVVVVTNSIEEHARQRALVEVCPQVSFSFSYGAGHPDILFGNVAAKAASRAAAFQRLCKAHGVDPKRVYAFGDSPADATFLRSAGIGFAVGSTHQEATEAATFTLPHVEEGGVMTALHAIVASL